ncbi:MAG: transcriptional repressor [Clostridia bacterium]|nr:transcriptional repressor [Clostridia bacterium]
MSVDTGKLKCKRMTKQRRVIKEILCSTKSHPTAEAIYVEARKRLPDISLGTVYRNLQVLLDENAIIELNYGKGFSRFDGNTIPHYHFVCQDCGRVYDVDAPVCEEILKMANTKIPGQVTLHRLEFYGRCHNCLEKFGRIV